MGFFPFLGIMVRDIMYLDIGTASGQEARKY